MNSRLVEQVHRHHSSRGIISRIIGYSLALCAVLIFGGSAIASATLIGDEVRIQISSVDATFDVASGSTPDFSFSSFNRNVDDSSIIFFIGVSAMRHWRPVYLLAGIGLAGLSLFRRRPGHTR